MTFFKELLSENGKVSAMRFSLVSGVVFIAFLVALIGFIVLKQFDMAYIDKLVFAIQWVAGIFIVGKFAQKFAEVKEGKSVNAETEITK